LGGRRRLTQCNPETAAWRVDAFRAYADYTLTPEFNAALEELEQAATRTPTAYMCAEAQWTRCHRRLISNALLARGWRVMDIMARNRVEAHRLPDFARVENGVVTYPAAPEDVTLALPLE
jgi:uncharacterized protein (DUF488 family)